MGAGAPTKYTDDIPKKMMDYFDVEATKTIMAKFYDKNGKLSREEEKEIANTLPTIEGFCRLIGISKSTLHEWLSDESKIELSNAYKICKEIQLQIWQDNSLKGLYNPIFTIFMGKNVFGWTDKVEIKSDIKTSSETITPEVADQILKEALERKNK